LETACLVDEQATAKEANANESNAAKKAARREAAAAAKRAISETPNAPADQDRAVAYIDRVIDRQLNKCRGVLTFNGLLLASVKLLLDNVLKEPSSCWQTTGLVSLCACAAGLMLSSLVLLNLLFVHWRIGGTYKTFGSEFATSVELTALRSRHLSFSLRLSVFAVVVLTLGGPIGLVPGGAKSRGGDAPIADAGTLVGVAPSAIPLPPTASSTP
jgi:hypothetical protein